MRVYIPATLALVHAWRAANTIPSDVAAYAVTAAVIAAFPDEVEEQEYAATILAADESVVLLAADASTTRRRVVVAADIDAAAVDIDRDPDAGGAVALSADVPWNQVAALLVDDPAANHAVAEALESGEPDVLDDWALLWFAPDELDELGAATD